MPVAHAADRMAVREVIAAVREVIPAVREATAVVRVAATAVAVAMLAASAAAAVMLAVAVAMAAADTGKQLRLSSKRLACFGRRAFFCELKLLARDSLTSAEDYWGRTSMPVTVA
jgi:hypothetical protein